MFDAYLKSKGEFTDDDLHNNNNNNNSPRHKHEIVDEAGSGSDRERGCKLVIQGPEVKLSLNEVIVAAP